MLEPFTFMTSILDKISSRLWNRIAGLRRKRTTEGLLIGYAIEDGKPTKRKVYLPHDQRAEHIGIVGRTGTGKSFFILSLILQDLNAGRGFLLIDLHGELTKFVLQAATVLEKKRGIDLSERLILVRPSDPNFSIGWNPFESLGGFDVFNLISEFTQILKQRWDLNQFGARTEELLRNSLHVISACGLTILELPLLLSDAGFRAKCLKRVANVEFVRYFNERFDSASEAMQRAFSSPVTNKVTTYTIDPRFRHLFGQAHSTFTKHDILEKNCSVIINSSKGEEGEQASLLASLFITIFKNWAFGRKSRRLYTIYADECQNYTANLEIFVTELRKYGISTVLGTQFRGQLPPQTLAALDGVATHISFQVSPKDANDIASALDGGKSVAELLKNLPKRQMLYKTGSGPFQRLLVPEVRTEKVDTSDLEQRCVNRWARPRAEVEAEIQERQKTGTRNSREALDEWE